MAHDDDDARREGNVDFAEINIAEKIEDTPAIMMPVDERLQ